MPDGALKRLDHTLGATFHRSNGSQRRMHHQRIANVDT
jgi:hypothetical protein